MKKIKTLLMLVVCSFILTLSPACGKDDDDTPPKQQSIVGTWEFSETETEEDGSFNSVRMILVFNSDRTGSIEEIWSFQTKSSGSENYKMKFNWTSSTDSNGNDILKISYVSGDKNTELFPGDENTVLWSRQYVLTGTILNIYLGSGVCVFNKI